MAREATARLYGVDHHGLAFKRLTHTGSYDEGTIEFRANPGQLIDLDLLHESLWATRLSGGTRSGVLKLEVTLSGEFQRDGERIIVRGESGEPTFVLLEDTELKSDEQQSQVFGELLKALDRGDRIATVTGRVDGWKGRWPAILREKPSKPQRVLISAFQLAEKEQTAAP